MQQGKLARPRLAPAIIASVIGVALVGGCSSGDDESSRGPGDRAQARGASAASDGEASSGAAAGGSAAAGRESLTGVWEGTYECVQGQTGLRLTVDDRGDGEVGASFEYFPAGGNPDVATGSYTMTGSDAEGALQLEGDEWLEQGGDYSMVGIEADVADRPDTEALEGTIVGQGCTSFAVERVSTDPWFVGAWEGAYDCAQGATGLTLTIDAALDGQVSATYELYAVPENPDVPRGSFRMVGTYEAGLLALEGDEWIEQPPGYEMVGYESNPALGIDPDHLFGTVRGAGCSLFTLDKVER